MPVSKRRWCKGCGKRKPTRQFPKTAHPCYCLPCTAERSRAWRAKNPEKARTATKRWLAVPENRQRTLIKLEEWKKNNRERWLRSIKEASLRQRYGITLADYDAMLKAQGGGCAICAKPPGKRRLAVDHDHKTGRIRGLLCSGCNTTLGWLELAQAWLKQQGEVKVLTYLRGKVKVSA